MPPPSLHMKHFRPSGFSIFVLLVFSTLVSGLARGVGASFERPEIFPDKEELLLEDGQPLNLTCRAAQPVAWCSDYTFTTEEYEEMYEEGHPKPYISILTINKVNHSHVGYFSCVYNTSENKENANCNTSDPTIASIYLFVRDLEHLLVPQRMIFLITGVVGESVLVPCKPTFPEVAVTLTRNEISPKCEGCVYDDKVGYRVQMSQNAVVEHVTCQGRYNGSSQDNLFILRAIKDIHVHPPVVNAEGAWQEDKVAEAETNSMVYYVKEGSTVNLTCSSNESKLPTGYKLMWTNNSHINESGTHRIIRQPGWSRARQKARWYEIQDARLLDSGTYTCWSKIYNTKKASASLNLTVIPKDSTYIYSTIHNPNVTVMEEPVRWEIFFLAHPEPNFKWMKGGKLLRDSMNTNSRDQSSNYKMEWTREEGTLSLSLHHPKIEDNGMYIVEASLNGTNIIKNTTFYLLIPGKPQNVAINGSDNQMFREKQSFSITCSAEGYPKPDITLNFIPYNKSSSTSNHDDTEGPRVYNQVQEESAIEQLEGNTIVNRSMTWMGVAEQPGWYQCEATNELGTDKSQKRTFLLTDGEPLSIISLKLLIDGEVRGGGESRAPVSVVEGDNVTLRCRANKQLAKPPLTWKLDGAPLSAHAKELWGIEVYENETHFSLLSTVRAPSLQRVSSNATLRCSDQGGIHASLTFHVQEMKEPTWRRGKPPPEYVMNKNSNLTLSCQVDGTPAPRIVWKKGDRTLEDTHRHKMNNNNQELFFPTLIPSDNGQYTCEVTNRAGRLAATFNVVVRDPDNQKTVIILVVVGILFVALVVLSIFFCRKIYQARKETLNLQLQDQKMFIEGDPSSLNPDISLEQQAELLPYNNKYEVSRDSIIFDKLLGAGAFARVYRATALNLLPNERRTTVAVKMMKSRTDCAQLKALRSEVKIMIHIGRHINIVNLLGACSKNLASKGELLLLVEYCKHGNILDYMRRHRREFINQINDEDKIDPAFCIEPRPRHRSDSSTRSHTSKGLKYAHLNFHQDNVFYGHEQPADAATMTTHLRAPSRMNGDAGGAGDGNSGRPFRARTVSSSSGCHQIASDNSLMPPSETSAGTSDGYLSAQSLMGPQAPLCSMDILAWAYQVAKGMEYLAFKKVLHGDLAARNVLLAENNVVKISDFGLAKDIYKNDNYRKRSNGPVPVKWMAVESLRDGVFSTQSDVWSFGVVLWEIFSLGQVPYSCTDYDETFIVKLEKGVRLEQPRYATYGLYRVMLECWNNDPMERPSFTSLEASLGEMLGEAQRQNYIQLTDPYYQDENSSELLDLLPSQDYSNKVRGTSPQLTEDGYEMPFSPGVAPQVMVCNGEPSPNSRFTSRQMEYLQTAADKDMGSTYVPMSSDCTDSRIVFDFDNATVTSLMGPGDGQDSSDLYLKMDKTTPQRSPAPESADGTGSRGPQESPRRLVLRSISSQSSNSRKGHRALTKHDSGVYSPTVMSQTNPAYMNATPLLAPDHHNINNNKETLEDNNLAYMNIHPAAPVKARDYLADGKCEIEYANLLPEETGRDRSLSDSSSGVGSNEDSPPRERGRTPRKSPPILEETQLPIPV